MQRYTHVSAVQNRKTPDTLGGIIPESFEFYWNAFLENPVSWYLQSMVHLRIPVRILTKKEKSTKQRNLLLNLDFDSSTYCTISRF